MYCVQVKVVFPSKYTAYKPEPGLTVVVGTERMYVLEELTNSLRFARPSPGGRITNELNVFPFRRFIRCICFEPVLASSENP